MNRQISHIVMLLCTLCLFSCQSEIIEQRGAKGYLSLYVEADLSEDMITKADDAQEHVFAVGVYDASGSVVASTDDHREVTSSNPFVLRQGHYTVKATEGTKKNAAFNNPYYMGEKAVRILPERENTVSMTCGLANTIFSVDFPTSFADHFTTYEVSVTNGQGESLVLSNAPEAGNALEAGFDSRAYFDVTGKLTWSLVLINKEGREYKAIGGTYNDVRAKQHYHLSFELGDDDTSDGAFIVKITLDTSVEDCDHEIILDFDNRNLPTTQTNDEFSVEDGEYATVTVGNTVEKVLTFNTEAGMSSLRSSHNNPLLVEAGLPENVEYVAMDAQTQQQLAQAGVVVTQAPASKSLASGSSGASIDITSLVSKLPIGKYEITFISLDKKGHFDDFKVCMEIISDVDAEAISGTAWAKFAYLQARYFAAEPPAGLTFQYKEVTGISWEELDPSKVQINRSTLQYSARVDRLEPGTEYVFRAVSAEDKETKEVTFRTEGAPALHNLNFDSWSDSNKYPNASGYSVWDSANSSGAAITTSPVSDAVSGKAARLETVTAFGMLAAGNIFTGSFVGLAGLGAELDWGYSFNSRPIALKGYFKYSPKTIDKTKDPYNDKKGNTDECQILISLTDWSNQFRINTNTKKFVDFDTDPGIIAYGIFNTSQKVEGYREVVIPLVYRSNTRIPNYIVVAAASSRYGDYFTGGVGSVLWIDEFELIYDPADLTKEQFNQVFSRVNPY